MKRIISSILMVVLLTSLSGCRKKQVVITKKQPITLTYYKLYENQENLNPIFTEFRKKYPYVTVNYRKFTDPDKYYETILNEFAEGRGPDVFSVPNWWVKPNYLKLSEAPQTIVNPQVYRNVFLDIASTDNIILDNAGGEHIYGMPMSIDTLGVYYNKSHYEAAIPERGRPASTWLAMQSDARILNFKQNNALIRSISPIGDPTRNTKEIDLLYNRIVQSGEEFYNKNFTGSTFAKSLELENIVKYQLSYADYKSPNYATNENIVASESTNKEVEAFVTGKTSMIFGYSHLYKDLISVQTGLKRQGQDVIEISDIQINEIPQENINDDKAAYANYFSEVVSKNSKNNLEAWALVSHMISKESLKSLYSKNFKPTSRRDMVSEQRNNRIYYPFVNQLGYAKSLPIADDIKYRDILSNMMINTLQDPNYKITTRKQMSNAQAQMNTILSTKPLNQIINIAK